MEIEGRGGTQEGRYGRQSRPQELNEKGPGGWKRVLYLGSSMNRGIILLCAWRYVVEVQARKVSYMLITEGFEHHWKSLDFVVNRELLEVWEQRGDALYPKVGKSLLSLDSLPGPLLEPLSLLQK